MPKLAGRIASALSRAGSRCACSGDGCRHGIWTALRQSLPRRVPAPVATG